MEYRSFIVVDVGGNLDIHNSTFSFITNIFESPVISSVGIRAEVHAYDSKFLNNTSLDGGIFGAQSRALIQWTRWNITDNFAIK